MKTNKAEAVKNMPKVHGWLSGTVPALWVIWIQSLAPPNHCSGSNRGRRNEGAWQDHALRGLVCAQRAKDQKIMLLPTPLCSKERRRWETDGYSLSKLLLHVISGNWKVCERKQNPSYKLNFGYSGLTLYSGSELRSHSCPNIKYL